MTGRRVLVLATLLATLSSTLGARAAAITTCVFGGPTPGYSAARLELPEGTDFVSIEKHGGRPGRFAGPESWHLAQGMLIIDAATLDIVSFRVESVGSAPRAVVVDVDGTRVARQEHPGPDGPFYHQAAHPRPGLAPGTYFLVGFGSDGGRAFPNDWWGADVRVGGSHRCTPVGTGEVFDFDQTHFDGGTHAYAGPVGHAEGITLSWETPRQLVVGLMDAAVQAVGEAELDYSMPSASGTIEDEIEPFVSLGGRLDFEARYAGPYPLMLIAGVALDLTV